MNRYEFSTPRTAFGVAATVMSALTMGFMVILPASVISARHESTILAASKAAGPAAIEAWILPARIDVVGECDPALALEPVRQAQRNVDQSS
jgi:hypothetical protein